MSINKKAQIRYLTLDKCLRNNGRLWSWKNLLDAVNDVLGEETNPKTKQPMKIAKTQLYEDLKDLEYRVYSAPVKRTNSGKTVYYSYENPNYSIQNAPLNETEAKQLKSAQSHRRKMKYSPKIKCRAHNAFSTVDVRVSDGLAHRPKTIS
jgi:hypothetical protein